MLKKLKYITKDLVLGDKKEFSQGENFRALTMCKKCYTFYYKNSWHFNSPDYLQNVTSEKEFPVRFTQCPACLEQEQALYERELENIEGKSVSVWDNLQNNRDDDSLVWNN